jgi:hypothetical protein
MRHLNLLGEELVDDVDLIQMPLAHEKALGGVEWPDLWPAAT